MSTPESQDGFYTTKLDPEEVTEGLEQYLQLSTVARLMDVGTRTVERWIKEGILEAWRFPNIRGQRVSRSSYIALVNKRYGASE